MAGKIKEIIDTIIHERSNGNSAIAEMMKAKFILKGINLEKYDSESPDDPIIIDKLLTFVEQLNEKKRVEESTNIKSVFSIESSEIDVVIDIKNQLDDFGIKVIVFFASSHYDLNKLSNLMQDAFRECIVFGCSTAGEIATGVLLKNSVVVMAIGSNIIADVKVEVIKHISKNQSVESAFTSFERYFSENFYTMDVKRYVGMVLIDGVCMKEEELMDQIGNRTNVCFVGGSAGDNLKFERTFVCANGKAYSDAALLVMMKMNDNAEFDIIKTQSFKVLDHKLTANKVCEETREVIEFNNRPAILAYADAVGAASAEEGPNYFNTNPVGLIAGENGIFVRSPRQIIGTKIKFYCNLLEGMEVSLLESTNIIEDTKKALSDKRNEFGFIEGLINFNCIKRTLELEDKNLVKQFGEIFSEIQTAGFSTYGEQYIGHINQSSTMLVFKYNAVQSNNDTDKSANLIPTKKQRLTEKLYEKLMSENSYLHRVVEEQNQHLQEITAELIEFNIMLKNEINERAKREDEIRYLSYHDTLTGLYNRRYYEEEIVKLDTTSNLPLSIVMGDVNGLKCINDTFGHDKGDELLRKAGACIQNACRLNDVVARWGGDEFIILLPKTKTDEADQIIKNIKDLCSKEQINSISIEISFGRGTKNTSDEEILNILKRAEDYMYENKTIDKQQLVV